MAEEEAKNYFSASRELPVSVKKIIFATVRPHELRTALNKILHPEREAEKKAKNLEPLEPFEPFEPHSKHEHILLASTRPEVFAALYLK